jgi:methionyl-tRNA formyltransferase
VKIAAPVVSDFTLAPGEISFHEKKVFVGTGTFALEIGYITSAGKQQSPASAWANGARLNPGERCE